MDISLPEDAARRILALYRNAVDELHDPPFDDVLTAIAAQHPGLVEEFSEAPWPQDIPGTIPSPSSSPAPLNRAYTQAELDAAVMAERERCAALVDPKGWESLHPSDGEYLVLERAARKIRGD
jgi:hypothetical protein